MNPRRTTPPDGLYACIRGAVQPAGERSERQFKVPNAGDGVEHVRLCILEAQRFVDSNCRLHRWYRVQPHSGVSGLPGFFDERPGYGLTDAFAAEGRPHVEALHLTIDRKSTRLNS